MRVVVFEAASPPQGWRSIESAGGVVEGGESDASWILYAKSGKVDFPRRRMPRHGVGGVLWVGTCGSMMGPKFGDHSRSFEGDRKLFCLSTAPST